MTETSRQFDSVVVGLGRTGASVVDYLLTCGQTIAAVDSRMEPPELARLQQRYTDLAVYLGDFHEDILASADQIVVSPGVSLKEPAIQAALSSGVKLSSDVELFCRQARAPMVAVTGSNGKSTVVTLLSEMISHSGLKVGLAGNIGTPVLELLAGEEPDFYVLELSSFQLEALQSMNAVAAVVLNLSADHMDRYRGLDEYAAAKQKIFAGNGRMIINHDDPLVTAMQIQGRDSIIYGLIEPGPNEFGVRIVDDEQWLFHGKQKLLPASALKLHGRHNLANALATLALGTAINLPMPGMLEVLQRFSGLPHRCQWVANINGVDWYNDSKGTNVGATCAAIEGLAEKGKLILIAGGDGKHADFGPLARVIEKHVRAVILIGKDASLIAAALAESSQRYLATSMPAAVTAAAGLAVAGETVLLSPACASLDMFRDYQHRGEVFCGSVRDLEGAQR